jgi:large subunit ribosomal protein L6
MSRIGKKSVTIPKDVRVSIEGTQVVVTGKLGKLECHVPDLIGIDYDSSSGLINVSRKSDESLARSLHGLVRSLIANSVLGVCVPWVKRLEIIGVGYQASISNSILTLNVGYANPLLVNIPSQVRCEVPDPTHIVLSSVDKQLVGQIAANIRSLRPPEPYKGKGIRYIDEHVKRKSGKAFGS